MNNFLSRILQWQNEAVNVAATWTVNGVIITIAHKFSNINDKQKSLSQ